jgi:hypothetical protein
LKWSELVWPALCVNEDRALKWSELVWPALCVNEDRALKWSEIGLARALRQ